MSEYNPILHAPKGANKKPKRVGRGSSSGHGTTAGRGNKGQQSRSGKRIPYVGFEGGQMPLYRRIARRGFSNAPFKQEYSIVNICDIEAKFEAGDEVNAKTLKEKGLLKGKNAALKILAKGDLTKKVSVSAEKVSKAAQAKIQNAGGSVSIIEKSAAGEKQKAEK